MWRLVKQYRIEAGWFLLLLVLMLLTPKKTFALPYWGKFPMEVQYCDDSEPGDCYEPEGQ